MSENVDRKSELVDEVDVENRMYQRATQALKQPGIRVYHFPQPTRADDQKIDQYIRVLLNLFRVNAYIPIFRDLDQTRILSQAKTGAERPRRVRQAIDHFESLARTNIAYVSKREMVYPARNVHEQTAEQVFGSWYNSHSQIPIYQDLKRMQIDQFLDKEVRLYFGLLEPISKFYRYDFFHSEVRLYRKPYCVLYTQSVQGNFRRLLVHNPIGPAIFWPSGEVQYMFNGSTISDPRYIEVPSEHCDPLWIANERNTQVRAFLIRKIGIERFIARVGSIELDHWYDEATPWKRYSLIECRHEALAIDTATFNMNTSTMIRQPRYPRFLKMWNPSEQIWHLEGVPPTISSVKQAIAWQDGEDDYIEPTILT